MSSAMLERVAARAASLRAAKEADWQAVARDAPDLAAFASGLRKACGERVNAVIYKGVRYGEAPLERIVPPIPGGGL